MIKDQKDMHGIVSSDTVVLRLRRLIEKIESGEVVVEEFSQHAQLEALEPKNGAKQYRNTGCYVGLILYRRNGPAADIIVKPR